MQYLIFVGATILSYLIGSFPTSYVLGKALKGIDIRDSGSGNAGATNVLRTIGKLPALATLAIDILKGVIVVTVVANYSYVFTQDIDYDFYRAFLGLAAVCGHVWPVFLNFRGGKGVATTLGVGVVIAPLIFIPCLAIWLAIFFATNYVSAASILALMAFPIIASLFSYPFWSIVISVGICGIVIYKHKENIKRLVRGDENKTVLFKKRNKS